MARRDVALVAAAVGATALATVPIAYMLFGRRVFTRRYHIDCGPPVLPPRDTFVAFGDVPGANRGDNPMPVPLYLRDPYHHARDDARTDPAILEHLRCENEYTAAMTADQSDLRQQLYDEILSHVQETDEDVPYRIGTTAFKYYTRTVQGLSYQLHCRRDDNGDEQVLLDENELAVGHAHCVVHSVEPSPSQERLAYAIDTEGYETYTIFIKDLSSRTLLADRLEGCSGSLVWGHDDRHLFYTTMDAAHRSDKVWRHTLGTTQDEDACLYTENDEVFRAFVDKTRSGRYLTLGSGSSETSDCYIVDLSTGNIDLVPVGGRQEGVLVNVDHHGEHLYIVTNRDGATNFKVMRAPVSAPGVWTDLMPYDAAVKIDAVMCFSAHLAVVGRQGGLTQLWTVALGGADAKVALKPVQFDDPLYTVSASSHNEVYDCKSVRIIYSSLTTPSRTYDCHMGTGVLTLLREKPCPGYQRNLYESKRVMVRSGDGNVDIPVSMVYRKDKLPVGGGPRPVHLYGYGSYEISIDPDFRATLLPLLDRGVTYAIAHVRGGGEMGRTWYEDAKYLTKARTFDDFIVCAEHLIASGVTTPSMLTCEGRSAGGLLVGAVLNMRPDLFKAAIAGVPFVDVMNSMCDSTIPLTTGEWVEWGNPNCADFFSYMLSYSPYENVRAQAYPSLLVTSGLYDPRVAYWEPTKWVAKLRALKTDDNVVLLKMDLDSGHFSASDRYHYIREKAFDYAFLLRQHNLA